MNVEPLSGNRQAYCKSVTILVKCDLDIHPEGKSCAPLGANIYSPG
jgi:hypothetical protein